MPLITDRQQVYQALTGSASPLLKALQAAERRCGELEEALSSRSQLVDMLQQEVSSADQQKQVDEVVLRLF